MWGESIVREILSSEIYAGTHYYNRLNPNREPGQSRIRDRSEWIPISVPAIVQRDLWEAAQRLRAENKKGAARNTRHPYLMRGRLRCAKCGYIMGCRTDNRFERPRGIYVCNGGKTIHYMDDMKTPICRGNVKSEVIDDAVWNQIKTVLQSPQVIVSALQQEADEHEAALTIIRGRLEIAEKQLANFVSQRERLLSLYLNDGFPKDLLDEKMSEIKTMMGKFESEAASLRNQLTGCTPAIQDIENIMRYCEQIGGEIEEFTFEDKQKIIEALNVTALVTRDDQGAKLVLSGYFPEITTDAFDRVTTR